MDTNEYMKALQVNSTFTKNDTMVLKGVAIMFMLFLHLFNQIQNVDLCTNLFYVGGVPFANLLTRCTNPVTFFIFLSGYGLYISFRKGKRGNGKRIAKLYLHYWISLAIFVTIGAFVIGTSKYPGTWQNALINITAWNTTYNGEIWFLFPYMLLALTSPWLFKIMDKMNPIILFIITGIFHFATYLSIHLYGASYLYNHMLPYMPILYFNLLFGFTLGMLCAK
jgi:hypothetical protein